ncbi:hypothetical protein [Streptomyces sp. UNOC14_S4]|uniref:hypothetical protein n=1 Tax=Streptomyces sp. UNOC14_S4 TaxID=2872340 RepID=UPI001E624707|nr:hypothetical protein [Streptomyces sp. UNOC14_S4]MCC3769625.1 hypothetical protein [Streptomyces sp. UNOC14_S4]
MTRSSGHRPASAAALHQALAALGAAPTLDHARRPHGPRPQYAPLLLGILLAKAELDAAVRADPAADPPDGLTALIRGYHTLTRSEEARLRLLTLRLVRTAFDITLYEEPGDPCTPAAENAAMTAANMINACRLTRHGTGPDDQHALTTALESAHQFHHSTAQALKQARRQLTKNRSL